MDKLELNRFANTLKISPVEIIREETELIILDKIAQSELGSQIIFKGGTALRLCYGSPRFSQDLDFNATGKLDKRQLASVLQTVVSDSGRIEVKDLFDKRYTLFALLSVASPSLKQTFSVKIEISKKVYRLKKNEVLIKAAASPVSPLTPLLPTYSLERILTEKLMAIKTRAEPRDYFDLWFIGEKLRQKIKFPRVNINPSRFKGELNQLLPDYLKNWAADFLNRHG